MLSGGFKPRLQADSDGNAAPCFFPCSIAGASLSPNKIKISVPLWRRQSIPLAPRRRIFSGVDAFLGKTLEGPISQTCCSQRTAYFLGRWGVYIEIKKIHIVQTSNWVICLVISLAEENSVFVQTSTQEWIRRMAPSSDRPVSAPRNSSQEGVW